MGGVETGKWGREVESKAIVAIAAEEDGKGVGRIRLRRIADVSAESLLPFVREVVVPGTHVHTDGWKGYAGLGQAGFKHRVSVVAANPDPAHVVMPRVHRVAAMFKRWLLGTHQGGVKAHQLDYYLDEFAFRFNRRRSKARGLLFHRLAGQAVAVPPAPYRAIVGKPANLAASERMGQ
jgi:transposase-like protein